MKQVVLLLLISLSVLLNAQDSSLVKFEQHKNQLNHRGMVVLTSWAGFSIAGGTTGYVLTNSYEEKQFYLMNAAWGAVNLGIALPGLLSKSKTGLKANDIQHSQTKTEKIFLANAVLDVAYMTGGLLLKEYGKGQSSVKQQQQFNGFGNAILLQGAGLFLFDTAMTILNNKNRKRNLDPLLQKTYFSFSGNSFRLGYRFN